MEERAMPKSAPSALWRDMGLLLVLLMVGGCVRTWLMRHTEVMARDGIGFITYAWQLEHQRWPQVLRGNAQHPLYPITVMLASVPVRQVMAARPLPDVMVVSAQLACTVAGLLLVFPMFYLGKALFNRGVGFGAALLFQCLPVSARATTDALSEGTFLLLATTALLFAVYALRRRSAVYFGLCGLASGLAYLTRPEGAFVVAAAGLVLLAVQILPRRRWPWRTAVACGATLATCTLLVALPYMAVIKEITPKHTAQAVLKRACADPPDDPAVHGVAVARPLAALTLAVWRADDNRVWWSLWAVATELDKAFHHAAWLAALLGLYWFRRRLDAGAWVLVVVCVLLGLVVWRVALVLGYLAERHVLLITLCGLFWAVAAIQELPRRLEVWQGSAHRLWPSAPVWSLVLLLILAGSGLPKTLQPLHPQRAGHRLAGQWLAEKATPADMLEDPFSWARYYAGWLFLDGPAATIPGKKREHYVITEYSKSAHSRLDLIPASVVRRAHLEYHCPLKAHKNHGEEVQIYTVSWTFQPVAGPPLQNVP